MSDNPSGDKNRHTAQPLPAFYDDLSATLAEAWAMLIRGAASGRSPIHTPAVATLGADGFPRVRTVVLRKADPSRRLLRFHTDARSEKVAQIAACPVVQILAYDPGRKIQLRLTGRATVHASDAVADTAWQGSRPFSRLCYRQAAAPGTQGETGEALTLPADHDGRENFRAVTVLIHEIDWLYLAHTGHRRARFRWPDGDCDEEIIAAKPDMTWLAP